MLPSSFPAAPVHGQRSTDDVLQAVRTASQKTGVDFSYLMAQAQQESGLKSNARADGSSATGLYQFIDSTWLGVMRDYGAKYGFGALASKIDTAADGSARVADPAVRQQILDLRFQPQISAVMAAEYARANQTHLERETNTDIGSTELYLAHFLGAAGASKFLNGYDANSAQAGASLFPEAAAANPSVFYDRDGKARSLADIYDRFASRIDTQTATISQARVAAPDNNKQAIKAEFASLLNLSGHALSPVTIMMLAALNDTAKDSFDNAAGDTATRALMQRLSRPTRTG